MATKAAGYGMLDQDSVVDSEQGTLRDLDRCICP